METHAGNSIQVRRASTRETAEERKARTASATAEHKRRAVQRAVDDPTRLDGAAQVVHAALIQEKLARSWAVRLAAQLPPFTPEEIAEAGRLAAQIDGRRQAEPEQAAS